MKPFLDQVACHYFQAGEVGSRCFIFPNRRSLAFFRKYLADAVKGSDKPVRAPEMLTVNDFFYRTVDACPTDRVRLLLVLYECYKKLKKQCEPLDDFIFWGDVLLADFDDVDKYLVGPRQLFTNVADFKGIQDTYSYLSDTQRHAIEDFMKHFHKEGKLTVNISSDNPDVKERFLQIWDLLYRLYTDFRTSLEKSGHSYEGQVYRKVADMLDGVPAPDLFQRSFPDTRCFVFVGLNALNECEKKVMRKMRDAGMAEFCWDYGEGMISDRRNKSSFFMSANIADFPQAFIPDSDCPVHLPCINIVSVPSGVGQAKQIPSILNEISGDGIETAIVLPDENLLIPVLNSIPETIRDVNVTMGYPMSGSEFFALMSDVSSMQMHLRCKDGKWLFYHKQVWAVFSNSVFKASLDEEGRRRMSAVKADAKYYIPQEDLNGIPVFDLVFRPVVKDPKAADKETIDAVCLYQTSLISGLAPALRTDPDMALELEFAREYYIAVNKLRSVCLEVKPATYFRLLHQLTGPVSVPFRGEPLKGLQIMGPLETRALDFDNIVILSCNEGVFPRRSVSSSFVPPELRKGFGLPTYEYQDAVWAYYFYRMIRRSSNVWILYDSRTESLKSGEESRYIKQLELHFNIPVKRYVARSLISSPDVAGDIPKTAGDVQKIRDSFLSASALQNYLYCPAKFYYHTVKGLAPETEVNESLDAGMIGNVFHNTMHDLYEKKTYVTSDFLSRLEADPDLIRNVIRDHIKKELNTIEVAGRNLIFEEVVLKYVMRTLSRDKELMAAYGTDRFEVLGLEQKRLWNFNGFRFIGYIDRMDSFRAGEVRIVDYKTGKVEDDDIFITDENAGKVVSKLFGSENEGRPKIALQLFLYDMFVSEDPAVRGRSVVNSIYQTSNLFVNGIRNVPVNQVFCDLMRDSLERLLEEISDVNVPFRRTDDEKTCAICDFKMICGK